MGGMGGGAGGGGSIGSAGGSLPRAAQAVFETEALHRPLRAGDTLLLEASGEFLETHRADTGRFALLAAVSNSMPPRRDSPRDRLRLGASFACLLLLLVLPTSGALPLLHVALAVCFLLVGIQCITLEQAWRAINYRVMLAIASSFSLGAALSNTSVSAVLAARLVSLSSSVDPVTFLGVIFLASSTLSCVVSNSATVVILYSVLREVDVPRTSDRQMMLMLMLGASCAFATPIGCQTNLMVLAAGGYRFGDYPALGGLLQLTVGFTAALLTHLMAGLYQDG
mmetsp:Transcript_78060/g.233949  ORF Transcript_78060/g.233949 Transcript_78060/m.233949 type:complete len:282 (+) Transcript_78060:2-847(+)